MNLTSTDIHLLINKHLPPLSDVDKKRYLHQIVSFRNRSLLETKISEWERKILSLIPQSNKIHLKSSQVLENSFEMQ